MSRRDGGYIKTQRIAKIKKEMTKHAPNPINIERLIMWIEANIGLTKRKAREYIEIASYGLDMVPDREGKRLLFEPEKEPELDKPPL